MKNLIFFFLLFSATPTIAQTSNCSIEEQILLNKRPSAISEEDAFYLIRNKIKRVNIDAPRVTAPVSVFPFLVVDTMYQRYVVLLSSNSDRLRNWRTVRETIFVSAPRTDKTFLIILSIVCFLTLLGSYGVSFDGIEGTWTYKITKEYIGWGIFISLVCGIAGAIIYANLCNITFLSASELLQFLLSIIMILSCLIVFFSYTLFAKFLGGKISSLKRKTKLQPG